MTQEEILEYNKRCAEFLNLHRDEETVIYKMSSYPYDYLKFDSDWNWIMEVLDKIAKIDYGWKVTSKYVNIYSHSGDPRGEFDCTHQINCPKDVKLDAVRTINQFLIWYEIQTNK